MFRKNLSLFLYTATKSPQAQLNRLTFKAHHSLKNVRCRNFDNKSTFNDNWVKCRYYSSSKGSNDNSKDTKDSTTTRVKAGIEKYKVFADYDSPVILDVDEERLLRLEKPELFEQKEEREDEFVGYNLERGVNGVFDVEELVDILRKENAQNICVISVPSHVQYVDHMVIVSGRSLKHLKAMAEFIRKLYKRKKAETDYFPVIEGKGSSDWMAIDLGNIAIHFQTAECREKYDIELLWAVGPEYDDKINAKEDQYITLLKQHTALADLEPLDSQEFNKKDINNSLN